MASFRLYALTIAVAGFLAMDGPVHEKRKEPPVSLEPVQLPDIEVETSSGPISFHDVVVRPESRKDRRLRVNGVVTNLTDRKWSGILFDLELLGPNGERVGHAPLMYTNLEREQSRRMSKGAEGELIQLLDANRREFSGYRIFYRTGELDIKYVLTMLKPRSNRLLAYADQDVTFSFSVSNACIDLKLKNNSRSPVNVDWGEAAFVDIFEQSHAIGHVGTGDSQIAPYETLSDSIEPVSTSAVETSQYEGWRVGRVLPRTRDAGELKGRTISLLLPVEVDGVKRSYRFVFQVAEILL